MLVPLLSRIDPTRDEAIEIVFGVIAAIAIVGVIVTACIYGWRVTAVRRRLHSLFGGRYRQLPVVTRSFSLLDLPNVRRGIEAFAKQLNGTVERLTVKGGQGLQSVQLVAAPPNFRQMDIDVDEREDCPTNPLYIVSAGDKSWAILIVGVANYGHSEPSMEVMSNTRDAASECIQTLRKLMRQHSIYRGKVISLDSQAYGMDDYDQPSSGPTRIKFHRLPEVGGDAIILPLETMQRIQRNTVRFFRNVQRLTQQGFSAKRGLLFHGPPGTGKTRTACWLTHSLPGVTVFLVTGDQLWNIKQSCQLAKELAPAMLILEDVDLIATRRDQSFQTTALHQLMNEMDGLDSDMEVLFLLTTNQPDQIEPALSNRPGRIDQTIHFPLPDEDCRRRLIELYCGRATLAVTDWGPIISRTAGASPAFIKELVRKAAMIAVEDSETSADPVKLTNESFGEALRDMLSGDGALTRRITGFSSDQAHAS